MTTNTAQSDKALTDFLQRLAKSTQNDIISPEEIHLLAESQVESSPRSSKSLGYICLTKIIDDVSSLDEEEERTQTLSSTFSPLLDIFKDINAPSQSYIPAISLFTSLFPLSPSTCLTLLTKPLETETHDPLAIILEAAELQGPIQICFARLLAAAAGTKVGRSMIKSRTMEWLIGGLNFGGEEEDELSGLCAVAIMKCNQEEQLPGQQQQQENEEGEANSSNPVEGISDEISLCDKMINLITSKTISPSDKVPALEGLSIISTKPIIKEYLVNSSKFLESLVKLSPIPKLKGGSLPVTPRTSTTEFDESKLFEPVETSVCYGITTILVNLSSPKPLLNAEEQQVANLRKMAISGKKPSSSIQRNEDGDIVDEEDLLDNTEHVGNRVKKLYAVGVIGSLSGLVRAESLLVKQSLGKLCLNLIEDQSNRLRFVKEGGFKVLNNIVKYLMDIISPPPSNTKKISQNNQPLLPSISTGTNGSNTSTTNQVDVIPALQALSKLIITTPPQLLFPPPHLTTSLNSLTPIYTLLFHPSSKSIHVFEALMALTNLSSIDSSIADRIVEATMKPISDPSSAGGMFNSLNKNTVEETQDKVKAKVIKKVEELILDDNLLIRRAALELICNLSASQKGFEHFTSPSSSTSSNSAMSTSSLSLFTDPSAKKDNDNDNDNDSGRSDHSKTFTTSSNRQTSNLLTSKLHIFLILIDSEDLKSQLAAGGILATLTDSSIACKEILSFKETSRFKSPWDRLIHYLKPEEIDESDDDEEGNDGKIKLISSKPVDEGIILRILYILGNLLRFVNNDLKGNIKEDELKKIKETDLMSSMREIVQNKGLGKDILGQVMEVVKELKELGAV